MLWRVACWLHSYDCTLAMLQALIRTETILLCHMYMDGVQVTFCCQDFIHLTCMPLTDMFPVGVGM